MCVRTLLYIATAGSFVSKCKKTGCKSNRSRVLMAKRVSPPNLNMGRLKTATSPETLASGKTDTDGFATKASPCIAVISALFSDHLQWDCKARESWYWNHKDLSFTSFNVTERCFCKIMYFSRACSEVELSTKWSFQVITLNIKTLFRNFLWATLLNLNAKRGHVCGQVCTCNKTTTFSRQRTV